MKRRGNSSPSRTEHLPAGGGSEAPRSKISWFSAEVSDLTDHRHRVCRALWKVLVAGEEGGQSVSPPSELTALLGRHAHCLLDLIKQVFIVIANVWGACYMPGLEKPVRSSLVR